MCIIAPNGSSFNVAKKKNLIILLLSSVAEYTGHMNSTYFVKSCISPCGSYLLSGSSDHSAYIWLTDHPGKPVAKLTGHFAEVTSVAWCPIDDEKVCFT